MLNSPPEPKRPRRNGKSGKVQYDDPASRRAAAIALGALQMLLLSLSKVRYNATIHGDIQLLEWVGTRIATLETQIRQLEEDLGL